jgi:regulator of protease activity HflC (stomatin/prohibitin superfamily)
MVREQVRNGISGLPVLLVLLVLMAGTLMLFISGARTLPEAPGVATAMMIAAAFAGVVEFFLLFGLFIVNPNEARVLQLFGDYAGTAKTTGLRWANPFFTKKRISQRVRSFESAHLKVNDKEGNPIEIGAVVVWKVVDTAEATFEVDNYETYVRVQSEAALRNAATSYPYDSHDEANVISLRGTTGAVADHLKEEMQQRLHKAGVEVLETRISHLAYAPEIAAAMLQRQQAGAIIAARQRIVEGAVGMVEMALASLAHKGIVTLDEERKAAMVSNLLVVLCGEKAAQPIVNTGTIHQ